MRKTSRRHNRRAHLVQSAALIRKRLHRLQYCHQKRANAHARQCRLEKHASAAEPLHRQAASLQNCDQKRANAHARQCRLELHPSGTEPLHRHGAKSMSRRFLAPLQRFTNRDREATKQRHSHNRTKQFQHCQNQRQRHHLLLPNRLCKLSSTLAVGGSWDLLHLPRCRVVIFNVPARAPPRASSGRRSTWSSTPPACTTQRVINR